MWRMLDAEEETDSPYDSCSGEAVDSAEKQREGGLAVDPTLRIHAVEKKCTASRLEITQCQLK